ncbi:hypothetical protein FBUS_10903 [Fasciolopsis buskii]|uniref:Uncharacterized protein n=1 Tax=Fasciolopsis buskii TaxID=27845 RepID=A0A8E0S510_9TREM|nr:hypothetical protein FBUS_10903 [Fasciolopsis buski]
MRADAHEKAITGSKRKWESDSRGTHVEMDVDQGVTGSSRPIQSSNTGSQHRLTTADSILTLSDLLYQESCSSMQSASSSSSSPSNNDTSDPSSGENEADAEGDGDESGSHSRCGSPAHSPFGFPGLRKSSNSVGIGITQNRRTSRASRSSICGGDSSDGISVNTKIPRLISGPGRSPDACITLTPSRRLERGTYGGGKHGQRSLCSCNRGLRQHRLQLRCDKSDSMLVDSMDDVLGLYDRVHRK